MIPAGFKIERIDDRRITVWKDDFGGYGATKDDKFSIASAVLYELADALLREDAQPAQTDAELDELWRRTWDAHATSADAARSMIPLRAFARAVLAAQPAQSADSWLQRVVDEKAELDARLAKLDTFFASPGFAVLEWSDRVLLSDQRIHMRRYSDALAARIDAARKESP